MPRPPRFDGPYNTKIFIRSVNANQLYNNNTLPQSHPKPQSSTSKPNPALTRSQPKPLEAQPQPKPLQIKPQPKLQPEPTLPKPRPAEPKPQPTEPKPQTSQPKPQPLQPKPQPTQPKPQTSQPKPQPLQPKPQPQPSQPQPKIQPSQINPQPPHPKPEGSQPQPQPIYFIPSQSFYNSHYKCNYEAFQYLPMYYAEEYIYYPYQPGPTFYLDVNVLQLTVGLVWIYPYHLQLILVPDYYNATPFQYVPTDMLVHPGGQIFPGFLENRHLHFLPEDTEACLHIVEALLPLQIDTMRLPGFFQFVKKPVILGNIKHRLLNGKYTRVVDVVHDLRAIVWNVEHHLSHVWDDQVKEDNEAFSQTLKHQLSTYYPGYNFDAITGNPDHKPE